MKKAYFVVIVLMLFSFNQPNSLKAGWFEKNTWTHVYGSVNELGPFSISSDYMHTVVHCSGFDVYCNIDKPFTTKFTALERAALRFIQ